MYYEKTVKNKEYEEEFTVIETVKGPKETDEESFVMFTWHLMKRSHELSEEYDSDVAMKMLETGDVEIAIPTGKKN